MDRSEEPSGLDYINITFDAETIITSNAGRIELITSCSKLTVASVLRYLLKALDEEDQGTDMA
jgi:hypothetical protein